MHVCPLVLSAGGPKGAFEAGAEARAHERGWRWNKISAVSVGALNACFISMGKRQELREMWEGITPNKVLSAPGALAVARRLSRRKPSLYPIKGVANYVDLIEPDEMQIETRVGAVSLITGEFVLFGQSHPAFKQAVLASCALPLVFPPVDIDAANPSMTDGGVRNYSPLGTVLRETTDHIMVINCVSSEVLRRSQAPRTALQVAQRSLEIAMHGIYAKDLDKARLINRMVRHCEEHGAPPPTSAGGRILRHIDVTVIEPESWIADITEYTAANATRAYEAGYEKAREKLG